MLSSVERERIKKGEPAALVAIAEAWAERHIRVLLASYVQVHSLTKQVAHRLQVDIQNGDLNVYDTFLKRERPYEAGDQSALEKGHVWLLPRTVDAWLDANDLRPTLATPSITPPVEWKAQSPYGILKSDDTDAGRLVRLADLVQWLMTTKEIPCRAAVELVCSILFEHASEAGRVLYLLAESDYAKPLPFDHSFFYLPIIALDEPYPGGGATDKGVMGAVKYMREYWGHSSTPGAGDWMGQHVLEPLAIRMEVAHWVWGYGSLQGEAHQTQVATMATRGTPKALTATQEADVVSLFNRGHGMSVRALAAKFQVSRPTIDKVLRRADVKR